MHYPQLPRFAFHLVPLPSFRTRLRPATTVSCDAPRSVTVTFRGERILATPGDNLRKVLLQAATPLHNGGRLVTCRGLGTCGTCAVAVRSGTLAPNLPSRREQARLALPPHRSDRSRHKALRLACQTTVVDDVVLDKYQGFWGHGDQLLPGNDD